MNSTKISFLTSGQGNSLDLGSGQTLDAGFTASSYLMIGSSGAYPHRGRAGLQAEVAGD